MKTRVGTLLAAVACLSMTGCGTKGTGEKVGIVTKLARTGFFCKTWEGQIIRGGFNSGSGAAGAPFEFTVEDPKLLPIIQHALENQQEIKLTYREELMTFCRSDSDDNFVTSVQVIGPAQHATSGAPNIAKADTAALLRIVAEQNQKILALVGGQQ